MESENAISLFKGSDIVKVSPVGLNLRNGITSKQYYEVGKILLRVKTSMHWLIGDWLNQSNRVRDFDEDVYSLLEEKTGYQVSTLQQYKSLSAKVKKENRLPELSINHHQAVMKLSGKLQKKWLDLAKEKGWTSRQLQEKLHEKMKDDDPEEQSDSEEDQETEDEEDMAEEEEDELRGICIDLISEMADMSNKMANLRNTSKELGRKIKDKNLVSTARSAFKKLTKELGRYADFWGIGEE